MLKIKNRVHHLLKHALLIAVLGMVSATPAEAHKLNIFAFAEGGKMLVDSYFVDGTKARDSKVKVFDPSGKLVVEGVTNKEGHFEFPVTAHVDLKITVDAGMGHRAEWRVSGADLGTETVAIAEKQQPAVSTTKKASVETAATAPTTDAAAIDQAVLQQVVNKAVAESMMPLMKSIEELKQHDSLTQIIGSIGYIFGVFGLWVFFKSRRENPSSSKGTSD